MVLLCCPHRKTSLALLNTAKPTSRLFQHFGRAVPRSSFLYLRQPDKMDHIQWFELFAVNFPSKHVSTGVSAPPSGTQQHPLPIAHPQRLWPLAQLNNALLILSLWYSLHSDAQGILSRCIITLIKYIKNNKNIQRRDWRNRQAAWSSCPRQGKEFSLAVNRQQQTLTKTTA